MRKPIVKNSWIQTVPATALEAVKAVYARDTSIEVIVVRDEGPNVHLMMVRY